MAPLDKSSSSRCLAAQRLLPPRFYHPSARSEIRLHKDLERLRRKPAFFRASTFLPPNASGQRSVPGHSDASSRIGIDFTAVKSARETVPMSRLSWFTTGRRRTHQYQPTVKGAANTASAIAYTAQTATGTSVATTQAWWDERASRKPKGARLHARAHRVVAAKYRYSGSRWQARAEIKCFLFICLPW